MDCYEGLLDLVKKDPTLGIFSARALLRILELKSGSHAMARQGYLWRQDRRKFQCVANGVLNNIKQEQRRPPVLTLSLQRTLPDGHQHRAIACKLLRWPEWFLHCQYSAGFNESWKFGRLHNSLGGGTAWSWPTMVAAMAAITVVMNRWWLSLSLS